MVVGACKITIHLPENGSLKGKRQIVKSVLARVRNEFNVAVAEVGSQDLWQTAELGIVAVSNSHAHVDEMLAKTVNFVERLRLDFEMGDYETETADLL
jgi:uncharacterized protein